MNKKIISYLIILLILSCKTENKNADSIQENTFKKDTLSEIDKPDYFQYTEYKIGHVNDGYGKRLYIDSLHYNIAV